MKLKESKLYLILDALSSIERRQFRDFIYIDPNKGKVRSLLDAVVMLIDTNKSDLYLQFSKDLSKTELRHLMSECVQDLGRFLVYKKYTSSKRVNLEVAESFIDMQYLNYAKHEVKLARKRSFKGFKYGLKRNEIATKLDKLDYDLSSLSDSSDLSVNLQKLLDRHQQNFLVQVLKHYCEARNRASILDEQYDYGWIPELLQLVKNQLHNYDYFIQIYVCVSELLGEDSDIWYDRLKKLVLKRTHNIEGKEIKDITAFMQNYCIRKINSGETEYLEELFDVYKILVDGNLLFEGKYISQWDFKNIVTSALRLMQLEWTEEFIKNNYMNLPEVEREQAYGYNMAWLEFSKGDYSIALKRLINLKLNGIQYQLDYRSLMLKTYYELKEIEPLNSLANSFSLYLRRNKKVTAYQKEIYLNQIRFVRSLQKIRLGHNERILKLGNELKTSPKVADLKWVRKKFNELGTK